MFNLNFVIFAWLMCFDGALSQSCKAPDNSAGVCISVRSCKHVTDIVNDVTISLSTKISTLKQYKCGEDKACCPLSTLDRTSAVIADIRSDLLPSRAECGQFTVPKVFGGNKTTIFEYPWAVLLSYRTPTRQYGCGGTLINKRYVLTAAHCVKLKGSIAHWGLISVRLGETDYSNHPDCDNELHKCNDMPLDIPIDQAIPHKDYNPELNINDIALLRLARNVEYTEFIKPVCLPTAEKEQRDDYLGREPTVVGWGYTETGRPSPAKLKVALPVMERQDCKQLFPLVTNNHVCAGGEKGKDSCGGDSGGGLFIRNQHNNWLAFGVVSYGLKYCGTSGYPGVYTKVGNYVDWIVKNMKP